MKPRFIPFDQKLLVFIGPSGVGKSTLVQKLAESRLVQLTPTWTTRPPRVNEENLFEHVFCSQQMFTAKKTAGEFVGYSKPFGLPYEYGLPRVSVTNSYEIPAVMLRSFLVAELKQSYKNCIIYAFEIDKKTVKNRLQQRHKHQANQPIGDRLKLYNQEISQGRLMADRIFILRSERSYNEVIEALHNDFDFDKDKRIL